MTVWVLLRGLARETGHWGQFPELLRARLPPGDVVLPLDLPGNGTRHRDCSPTRIAPMVECLRADLAERRLHRPCRVVALSLGGMVALEWAGAHPGELAGCVLINSSLAGLSPPWQRLRLSAWLPLAALLRPGLEARAREQGVLALTSNGPPDDALHRQWTACALERPVSRANVLRQLAAAARYRLPRRPAVPVLLLASQADRLVSAQCSRAMAAAWGVPLHVHPAAGHDLAVDAPAWLADRVAASAADES